MLFLQNAAGFDLALDTRFAPAVLPEWFHFGISFHNPEKVRLLYQKLDPKHILRDLIEKNETVKFEALDPDGYKIEIYWDKRLV